MNPKRQALWLTVNGKPNTLRQHFFEAGYRLGFETTACKRNKCKPSEIPVAELKKYLGDSDFGMGDHFWDFEDVNEADNPLVDFENDSWTPRPEQLNQEQDQ